MRARMPILAMLLLLEARCGASPSPVECDDTVSKECSVEAADAEDQADGCDCDTEGMECSIEGADGEDEVAGQAAGARLVKCLRASAGYTIHIAGVFVIPEPLVVPENTHLVGAQALAFDTYGRPVLDQHGLADCRARQCEPVLAPGARRTVIQGNDMCRLDADDFNVFDDYEKACWTVEAMVGVKAGGSLRRVTVTQDGGGNGHKPPIPGIRIEGSNVLVSEVDTFGNSSGIHVPGCAAGAVVEVGGSRRCTKGLSGVKVEQSAFRYAPKMGDVLVLGELEDSDLEATFDRNVLIGNHWYGLWLRTFNTSHVRIAVETRGNWIMEAGGGISVEARYGGTDNHITWTSHGDLVERNVEGVDVGGCLLSGPTDPPCSDNSVTAAIEGIVVKDSSSWALDAIGMLPNTMPAASPRNTGLITITGSRIEGKVICEGNDAFNQGQISGSVDSLLADNTFTQGVPSDCTTDPSD